MFIGFEREVRKQIEKCLGFEREVRKQIGLVVQLFSQKSLKIDLLNGNNKVD